jgi:hypothetical protein
MVTFFYNLSFAFLLVKWYPDQRRCGVAGRQVRGTRCFFFSVVMSAPLVKTLIMTEG